MKNLAIFASASLVALIAAMPATASTSLLLTDPGTGTTTTFTATSFNRAGSSPATVNGISVSGSPTVDFGNVTYGLASNGSWTQSWVATNGLGSITFDLGSDYSFVGALLNYAPGNGSALIIAMNADHAVLGTYDLTTLASISTPGAVNGGAFRGIESSNGDIRYLTLGGSYILAHSLTVGNDAAAAVPEASTWAMMLAGFGGIGFAMRRSKAKLAVTFA